MRLIGLEGRGILIILEAKGILVDQKKDTVSSRTHQYN